MSVNASGDDASAIIISADGSNGAEKGIEITTGGGNGDLVLGDEAWGSIYAPNGTTTDIIGSLSGSVGSVNARSDYMLRAGEAAQQSDITGSNLAVVSDLTEVALTTASASDLVNRVWDEEITNQLHNGANSAGKRLRQVASFVLANDTAEISNSPGNNQIQLASGESAVDGTFDPGIVGLLDGTGAGQCRMILEYAGATKIATLNRDWKINPSSDTEYIIMCSEGGTHVNEGLAQAGTSSDITLNSLASAEDDLYNGQLVFLVSGTGQDQVARVSDYDGTSKVATIATTANGWAVAPDNTTGYVMLPILSEKEGYSLAANGLDGMATTEPAGLASNFREMVVQTFRRFLGKTTMTATQLKTYKEDGTTVATTQIVADDGTTQSQGEAS